MRKRKWGAAVFAILGISVGAALFLKPQSQNIESPSHRKGMFEWKEERIEQLENVSELIDQFQITDWYQELGLPIEPKKTAKFVKQLHGQNVNVYALVGETDWGFESEGQSLIQYLEELVQYNKQRMPAERFDGVMVDVEPYTRSRWKQDPEENMKTYVSGMIAAYRFAQEHDLIFIACIPRHYDDQGLTEQLEVLIRDGCDEVAVMDYECGAEAEKIETEAQLAAKYDKVLHCILEFQEVGKHGLTEDKTYRNKGLTAAEAAWEQVDQTFPEMRIVHDYHWSMPLIEMMREESE
ncbi:hypothetical protein [Holdemania massiliensis]|uniref:hypothetical protein n=1 Tax=Holdemania massiliensis TaxID=1468449 RepID=UPI001F052BB0|nr:hypothetical protein [Holdemania massiliensis]MCH1942302.1 hypothetical protein [Holdemania massiliensis]